MKLSREDILPIFAIALVALCMAVVIMR